MLSASLRDRALVLAATGLPVFPCLKDKSPACAGGHLAASTDPETVKRLFSVPDAALIGVPTGPRSGFDVVDLDPRHGSDAWVDAKRLPLTRVHQTGGGGLHYLFRAAAGLRNSAGRVAPGVDVRAEGGFVVNWPVLLDEPIADWPVWLLAAAMPPTRDPSLVVGSADLAPPSAAVAIDVLDRMPNPIETSRDVYVQIMLAAKGCIDGLGDADGVMEAACRWAARWPGSPGYEAEIEKYEWDWSQRDAPLAGWQVIQRHALRSIPGFAHETAIAEFTAAPLPAESVDPEGWRAMLLRGKPRKGETLGGALPCLANVLVALRHAPEWRQVIALDEFAGKVVLRRAAPWGAAGVVTDETITRITEWLQCASLSVSSTTTQEAVSSVAAENGFHPVRDYLGGLVWDGVDRLDTWLSDYLGATDTPLNRAFASRFLIAVAARVFQPGCQVDSMLVCESDQGAGKSSVFQALAGEWAIDHMPDLHNKDAVMQIQGALIAEFAEMSTLRFADVNRVKAFITTRKDKIRPPFGRTTREYPRQCVFAGTVNPDGTGYLKDATGARRFWTVECCVGWATGRLVDIASFRVVRDQLFAEAVSRYRAGERWHLDTTELVQAQAIAAAARYDADVWDQVISDFVACRDCVTVAEILSPAGAVPTPVTQQSRTHQMRVASTLNHLGWKKAPALSGSKAHRYKYFPPDSEPSTVIRGVVWDVSMAELLA
jgi:predicted P-loop ATPase